MLVYLILMYSDFDSPMLSPFMLCSLSRHRCFFLDSPGGCGKTFLFNTLLAAIRARSKVAIAVASSGIAGLLLQGGTTSHSRFKIPIEVESNSHCNIRAQSEEAALIRAAELIVWDEAPMAHKHAFMAVDRTLKSLMGNNLPFVLSGDVWQD